MYLWLQSCMIQTWDDYLTFIVVFIIITIVISIIHPSISTEFILWRSWGELEPIPSDIGLEAGYSLGRLHYYYPS